MSETGRGKSTASNRDDASRAELEQLRDILLAPEKEQLADLRARLDDPDAQAEELSRILPAAMQRAAGKDGALAAAITPTVEKAVNDSVRRDPSVLINAIFPIMGPAIRKAIAEALATLLQSLNQTLEHTLSPQSFKWRLEARRTGKSFAEVVLSRTLVYRVEQVFLIHRETGLLLQHVHRLDGIDNNADLVSGMFTAIQDFARDSFGVTKADTLETMQVGELNVWIDSSPHVMLAAVIRGVAPKDFRAVMQSALERIHTDQRALLESFSGDSHPFTVTRPCLEGCLRLQAAERKRKRARPFLWIGLAVTMLAFVAWHLVSNYRAQERAVATERARVAAAAEREQARAAAAAEQEKAQAAAEAGRQADAARWEDFVGRLRSREGIVVTGAGRRDGKFHVTGLRDPLSADPAGALTESGVDPAQLVMHWEGYYALSPGIVLQRATRRLRPPPGVTLILRDDEVLVAAGDAPTAWIADARRIAETLPGISRFDGSGLRDATVVALDEAKSALEKIELGFEARAAAKTSDDPRVAEIAQRIGELRRLASAAGREVTVVVTGHTSVEGPPAFNARLGKDRAETAVSLLKAQLPGFTAFTVESAGARDAGTTDSADNRRVSFRAVITPAPGGTRQP